MHTVVWGRGGLCTYVVRRGDSNAILERVPAHMQNLLVEIDLIGVRLLAHPLPLSGPGAWTSRSRATLLPTVGRRRAC